MTYHGKVRNGVVELPPDATLPEGAEVRVEVIERSGSANAPDQVYAIGDLAVDTGVPEGFNAVNRLNGYKLVEIYSPLEVVES